MTGDTPLNEGQLLPVPNHRASRKRSADAGRPRGHEGARDDVERDFRRIRSAENLLRIEGNDTDSDDVDSPSAAHGCSSEALTDAPATASAASAERPRPVPANIQYAARAPRRPVDRSGAEGG